jgi:hypothetical protein
VTPELVRSFVTVAVRLVVWPWSNFEATEAREIEPTPEDGAPEEEPEQPTSKKTINADTKRARASFVRAANLSAFMIPLPHCLC